MNYLRIRHLFVFLVLIFSACSLTTSRMQSKKMPISNSKISIESQLADENTALKKENLFLQTKIEEIIRRQEDRRKSLDIKIDNLSKTINLLELSIQAQRTKSIASQTVDSKKPDPQSSKETKAGINPPKIVIKKQKSSKKSSTNVVDIQTPSSSGAIEVVSLLPEADIKPTSVKKTIQPRIKPPKRAKPIILINQEKHKPQKLVVLEDPDIQDPISPIKLEIVPGAKKLYRKAFKKFSGKRYLASVKDFSQFLERFPNDQDADNSQFWMGQAQFIVGNYLEAEHSFRKILKVYQHGNTRRGYKTPDSILMLGRIYLIREKPNRAKYYFRKVITMFPNSRSSVKAKNEIQSIDSILE